MTTKRRELTHDARQALLLLQAGVTIQATRQYPLPHEFHTREPGGHTRIIPAAAMVELVEAGLLKVIDHSPDYDRIDYALQEGGHDPRD